MKFWNRMSWSTVKSEKFPISPNDNKGDVHSILVVVHGYAQMPIRASKWYQKSMSAKLYEFFHEGLWLFMAWMVKGTELMLHADF